jgi:hypothetical protein
LGSEFATVRYLNCSPDGWHLLVVGYKSEKTYDLSALDWWILPTAGGAAIKTGVRDAFPAAGAATLWDLNHTLYREMM